MISAPAAIGVLAALGALVTDDTGDLRESAGVLITVRIAPRACAPRCDDGVGVLGATGGGIPLWLVWIAAALVVAGLVLVRQSSRIRALHRQIARMRRVLIPVTPYDGVTGHRDAATPGSPVSLDAPDPPRATRAGRDVEGGDR